MTDRELLQQIVNAWEHGSETGIVNTIENIRARLAQPEPEPVAWMFPDDLKRFQISETFATIFSVACGSPTQGKTVPLYTAPPKNEPVIDKTMATRIATQLGWQQKKEWVGLTDEEVDYFVDAIYKGFDMKPRNEVEIAYFERLIKFVGAKLEDKNT